MKTVQEITDILFYVDGASVHHKDDEFLIFQIGDLGVVVSLVGGWDHVVVSVIDRTPTYQEMKAIKRLCFRDDEWAYELHPPPSDYISVHDNALHMWRPQDGVWRVPPVEVFMKPWAKHEYLAPKREPTL